MIGLACISVQRIPILFSLSNNNSAPSPSPTTKRLVQRIKTDAPQPLPSASPPPSSSTPLKNNQQKGKQPSVAQIERAIGAGIFRDRDVNREAEPDKTLFDKILSISIGRTEGDAEKKLRETGEWIINRTERPTRSAGKNILKGIFLWVLPLWILSYLVASGLVKLPFSNPLLDDLIM